jgi:preprotein translocase subunit SecE
VARKQTATQAKNKPAKTEAEESGERTRKRERTRSASDGARRRSSGGTREAPRKGTKSRNPIIRYFQDTREELRKVSWPTQDETIRLSVIVLGTTVAFAIFLGLLDLLFQQLVGLLV